VIWPHGPGKLSEFLDHLNSIHESIQFTMETERDWHLPFLDIDIYRQSDGSLGHKVYRKPMHTNLYLNSTLTTILPTSRLYSHRARSLCDQESLHGEVEFLRTTFRQNGYSDRQIRQALNPPARVASTPEKPGSVAFLPYVSMTFNRNSRLLSRHNIKSVGLAPKKIPGFLQPVKYDLGLKDSWCVERALRVWSSLHWADWPFHQDQGKGAPVPHPSAASRQICRGRTKYQPGPPHPIPGHHHPIHQI
jgi:hypothetical protein